MQRTNSLSPSSPQSVGTALPAAATAGEACETDLSARMANMQHLRQEHVEDSKDILATFAVEQQLQAERSRAVHLERENQELSSKLAHTQQEHRRLEARYESSRQVIEAQEHELAEKTQLIEQLQHRLARLSNLAAAFSDEVHCASTAIEQSAAPPTYQAIFEPAQKQLQQGASAGFAPARPPSRDMIRRPDQQLNAQDQRAALTAQQQVAKAARHMELLLQQQPLPAAVAALSRLQQQQQQAGVGTTMAAAEAAVAEATAATAAAGMPLQAAPAVGSKRSRLCSATGSGGDATNPAAGTAAALKRAASGGSGSSSSRQQMSGDEEAVDELDDEVDCEHATTGSLSAKRQRSPGSSERMLGAGELSEQHDGLEADDNDEDDKSQDDLDAAQCLQQLAMSAAEVVQGSGQGTCLPTSFDSMGSHSERFGSGSHILPGRSGSCGLAPWGSAGGQVGASPSGGAAAPPAAAAGSHLYGSSSSSASGGFTPLQAQLLGYLQANGVEGFESFQNHIRSGQQMLSQQKRPSVNFMQQPNQMKQLHHFGSNAAAGALGGARRVESLGGSWNPALKVGVPAGNMAAPTRARKQSWFQTEIAEKIPLSVQQACAQDWAAQQCMQVVCADLCGTFYVNSGGEYLIKLANSGEVVTPNKFEELAGKKTARNWQQSIRLVGYTMNGEPNSALLKLGHFTRIVGLVQDR